jgi:predicted RNase H-like HicB family nuclease
MTTKSQFTAVYKKTKDWVVAWVEEIPGVNTQGKTMKEARANLQEALLLVLEANRDFSRSTLKKNLTKKRERINVTMVA